MPFRLSARISPVLPLSLGLFHAALMAQRRQAVLGYMWLFLPAAAAALTAGYVRSRGLFSVATTSMPYAVFVFSGTVLWQVFLEALNAPLDRLQANRAMVTRLNFPHAALILSGVWMAWLNAAVRLVAVLTLCLVLHVHVAASVVAIPLGVVALTVVGLAFGLVLAPVGLLYDDVGRGLQMVTLLLYFLMPIAYPIPSGGWQRLNPVAPLIDTTRGWLVGLPMEGIWTAPLGAAPVLVLSWLFYRLAQPHVIARLG